VNVVLPLPPIRENMQEYQCYIAIGGNLGDPPATFARAREMLAAHPRLRLLAASPLYRSPAVGTPTPQPDYTNGVLAVATPLHPLELLDILIDIERALGRVGKGDCAARTLDLDLLDHGGLLLKTPTLELPHPRMHHRAFVLRPLSDIAPMWTHPLLAMTAAALLCRCADKDALVALAL